MLDLNFDQFFQTYDKALENKEEINCINPEQDHDYWNDIREANSFIFESCIIEKEFKEKVTDLCKEEDILLNKSADKKEIQQARVGSANSNSKVYMTRRREQQTKEESKESLTISFTSTANNLDMSNGSYEELAKSFEKIDYFKRETGQTPQDIFSSLLEIAEEERIKHSGRFKRFGRKEDRDLFNKLKRLCSERGRSVTEFWIGEQAIDGTLDEVLSETLNQIEFKGDKLLLLKRIRKIASNKDFSIREKKLMRRLIEIQSKSFNIDFDQIEYFFPGKLSEIVRKEIGEALISL